MGSVVDCAGRSKDLVELARIYLKSERYRNLSPGRHAKNRKSLGWILEWSETRGHPAQIRRRGRASTKREPSAFRLGALRCVWSALRQERTFTERQKHIQLGNLERVSRFFARSIETESDALQTPRPALRNRRLGR